MRLFLALNFPPDVRGEIVAATAALRDVAPELSWVREPSLHLTMKFLGEQPDTRVDEIKAAVTAVARQHREMVMTLGGLGAFPNFRRARVVWMGVAQEPRLELLHHDVEVAFEQLGFEVDGRAFRPHLTLARVRTAVAEDRLRALSRAARGIEFRAEVGIRSIELMHSELGAGGSVYSALVSAALRSG